VTEEGILAEAALNIILADDHELIREAVKPYLAMLGSNIDIWEASTYDELFTLAERANKVANGAGLALIDLKMPGSDDDLNVFRDICGVLKNTAVVAFSATNDSATIAKVMQNGARGFVPKTMRGQSLVNALKLVMAGDIYLPPALLTSAPADDSNRSTAKDPNASAALSKLSVRERESLGLLMRGMTNKEIARELNLQDVTVKMHLRNAYRKLGAANRVEAVRIATEHGLR